MLGGKDFNCQCRRCRFHPWVGKILWRRKWQPTPVFLPRKSHGQRCLVGGSPWGHEKSDMTDHAHTHYSYQTMNNSSHKGSLLLCLVYFLPCFVLFTFHIISSQALWKVEAGAFCLFSVPISKWEDQGSESLNHLPKVTQPVHGRCRSGGVSGRDGAPSSLLAPFPSLTERTQFLSLL